MTSTHANCTHPATKAGRALCRRIRAAEARIEALQSAYCRKCGRDDLPTSLLCDRAPTTDLGIDRDSDLTARYEGICLRCCDHNHG